MSAWTLTDQGWRHRPWWKVAINSILRRLQPGPVKWVIATHARQDGDGEPVAVGYTFAPIRHEQ